MERVIVNLVTNACKYSAPASPVVVRVFRSDRNALISVTDQGVGVDTDDLPHLFDKHYRAKTAGTTKGSGLGLCGTRQIVEAAKPLGIAIHDHVIVGRQGHASLKALKLL